MQVTTPQLLAFLDCLLGWEMVGEGCRPKSPYVRTHLEAIFGLNELPISYVIEKLAEWPQREKIFSFERDDFYRLSRFAEYMRVISNKMDEILSDAESKFTD